MTDRPSPRRRAQDRRLAARAGGVAAVALLASLVLAAGLLSSPGRHGPPPHVTEGVLKDGPYAGVVIEIDPGQHTIGPLEPLVSFGAGPPPKRAVYVYSGREDAAHRAVFVLSGGRNPRSEG